VEDYDAVRAARDRLSEIGIRLAIDDVGMGFSGLNHILESALDTIKVDAAVVRDVHVNPLKQAMIEALVSFGGRVGVLVVAEGIQTAAELATLRTLGVPVGQGYHLRRPAPLQHHLVNRFRVRN
jgi:EAL domain-containing protein (putative c-di-GMP-specific phosphodiesterase class I)